MTTVPRFFVSHNDWDSPSATEVRNAEAFSRTPLWASKRIRTRVPPSRLDVKAVATLGDAIPNPWGYLVWSPRSRLRRPNASSYSLANTLARVDAVDKRRSRLLRHPEDGYVEGCDRLVLDAQRVGRRSMFRVSELPVALIVRAEVTDDILAAGCTGVRFQPIEDYGVWFSAPSTRSSRGHDRFSGRCAWGGGRRSHSRGVQGGVDIDVQA
jgi:hypothetical protein